MTHKLQLKNLVLSLVLALAMVAGALPGALPAHATSAEETWSDNQTIESTKTINGGVVVKNDVNLTINEDVTLTINNGLYIYEGVALTVKGKGTLIVNGHNGSNGSDTMDVDGLGGNGKNGGSAINGNIIVEGGRVTVTGGRGGSGGYGESSGGDGGDGGYGIEGNLTVNGGSVTVTGGSGGDGGTSPIQRGSNGSNAKAINGNISGATGLVAEESEDSSIWNYITGDSSDRQYVRAKVLEPVKVKIDVGKGHESLFTADVLNYIKNWFELEDVTISGNVITLKGVNPSNTEYGMWWTIDGFVNELVRPVYHMHNKERFRVSAYKPFDEYATYDDLDKDIYNKTHESTQVSDNLTYYLFWDKPYEKLEIDNGNPTCGNEMWKAFPTVPDGFIVDQEDSYWIDENEEDVEKFEGGKTYTFKGRIYHRPYGDLWKYFIDPDNFTMTVDDAKDLDYSINNDEIRVSFTATADHDWDEGTVTKEPTETADGEKLFKCKHCDATKTEAIPKKGSQTNAPKVTTTAKTSARAMTVKWTMKWGKVNGAKRYKVAYRKVGSKKWTYKTTKKTKYVVKGHKLKGLYEYKVAAISKKGAAWSSTSRRYFSGVKTKAKAGKSSIKVSWKKDKTATGYQVFVATNKNMKNSKKFEVGKSAKSYKITGLKKGKKYYVKVRPMKTHGGVTYKGILSKVKRVRVK